MNPWTEASASYRRKPWRRMEPGFLRMGKTTWYVLPRRVDEAEMRLRHAWYRLTRRCTECHMHQGHKFGCSRRG